MYVLYRLFQPFCGISVIRYNVLNDRVFPHGCYRTLVEYKCSSFLEIFAVSLRLLLVQKKCYSFGKMQIIQFYSLEKML